MKPRQLRQADVLVLNRRRQSYHLDSPVRAFGRLAQGTARGLAADTRRLRHLAWAEWRALPIRPGDRFAQTVDGPVRVPSVIVTTGRPSRAPARPRPTKPIPRKPPATPESL